MHPPPPPPTPPPNPTIQMMKGIRAIYSLTCTILMLSGQDTGWSDWYPGSCSSSCGLGQRTLSRMCYEGTFADCQSKNDSQRFKQEQCMVRRCRRMYDSIISERMEKRVLMMICVNSNGLQLSGSVQLLLLESYARGSSLSYRRQAGLRGR